MSDYTAVIWHHPNGRDAISVSRESSHHYIELMKRLDNEVVRGRLQIPESLAKKLMKALSEDM